MYTPGPVLPAGRHDDFGGLHRDLPQLLDRRRALRWMGGVGLAGLLAACGSSSDGSGAPTTTATTDSASQPTSTTAGGEAAPATTATTTGVDENSAGAEIPEETAGPFPADGSNGPNVLIEDGVVRADLTKSFGTLSGTAEGIPTDIQLTIVDAATGDPLGGSAVYLWHCTAGGQYSLYEIPDQNYLRGVQMADESGRVTFTTIFPGCYAGRWPHCHFEVYDSLGSATSGSQAAKTSQLALPQAECEAVYADSAYGTSTENLSRLSLASDNVFSDGWEEQLATVVGAGSSNVTASLLVRV